jgi:hypothetical protein
VIWNVKKTSEDIKEIMIAFSKGKSFDGSIRYDKQKQTFEIISLAGDCDEYDSKRLFQFLYGLIIQNTLSFEPYSVRIG